ncbi:MAG TPA: bifunctional precorrin-2 dehydrogenase/sirohydrochlorin ferrochelatase [Thermoanaerobaculia bacterium]|jgi:siroheme synthase-like protein
MHYPVYLDLNGRPCFVLGGCAMAEEKTRGLLLSGARVTVIASDLTEGLTGLAAQGRIDWISRRYRRGDLRGAFLVIVVSQGPAVAAGVWEETRGKNVLVNTLDDVPHCDFIAPAIVRRGDLSVAISTGGKAPVMAVRLRQRLEEELGQEHARFLELAGTVRKPLAELLPDLATRRDLWYRLIDSDVLHLLRSGDEPAALSLFEEILGVRPEAESIA